MMSALDLDFCNAVNQAEFGNNGEALAAILRSHRPLKADERERLAEVMLSLVERPIRHATKGAPGFGPGASHRVIVVHNYRQLKSKGLCEKQAAYEAGQCASTPVTPRTVQKWDKDLRDRELQIMQINLQ